MHKYNELNDRKWAEYGKWMHQSENENNTQRLTIALLHLFTNENLWIEAATPIIQVLEMWKAHFISEGINEKKESK